jgi:hypothetical protein
MMAQRSLKSLDFLKVRASDGESVLFFQYTFMATYIHTYQYCNCLYLSARTSILIMNSYFS